MSGAQGDWRESPQADEDLAFQARALEGVSRTFALTIPRLPGSLQHEVGNAYLLCRIADTIEDDPDLPADAKEAYLARFAQTVAGDASVDEFARDLSACLSPEAPAAERELVQNSVRVLRIFDSFGAEQQQAISRCVRIMTGGMAEFQHQASNAGLADWPDFSRYCYYVAGVVGEMLTDLMCASSPSIRARREELYRLSTRFGQGLQMVNIIKDVWADRRRGVCWLPRDVFQETGIELAGLGEADTTLADGMQNLTERAFGCLADGLRFTLLIPRNQVGIRRFCLLSLGLAVMTLRRIHDNPGFTDGSQVKVSRRTVWTTVGLTSLLTRSNAALRALFAVLAGGGNRLVASA